METKNPRAGSTGASKSTAADTEASTRNHPNPQPASVHQLRALRLIAAHNLRPELAQALAALVYDGGRR